MAAIQQTFAIFSWSASHSPRAVWIAPVAHARIPTPWAGVDNVAERLRRWTANPLGSPCVGSNPIVVDRMQADIDLRPRTFLFLPMRPSTRYCQS